MACCSELVDYLISALDGLTLDDIKDWLISEDICRGERGAALNIHGHEREVVGVEQGKKQVSAEGATLLELWPGGPHAARLQGAKEEQEATSFKHLASLQARILCMENTVESWILDSSASFHSTPAKELMSNFIAGKHGKVYLADGEALSILGKGEVLIHSTNSNRWTLKDVCYITI